jgi:hypothetical protein
VSRIERKWFPESRKPVPLADKIVKVFERVEHRITSDTKKLKSNQVLARIKKGLKKQGFEVESGKKAHEKITFNVPPGPIAFNVDAYAKKHRFVLEVEAGRAKDNNAFLKDLFQACLIPEVSYLCIAVRKKYRKRWDYGYVVSYLDKLYASNRLKLPLKGTLVIGY